MRHCRLPILSVLWLTLALGCGRVSEPAGDLNQDVQRVSFDQLVESKPANSTFNEIALASLDAQVSDADGADEPSETSETETDVEVASEATDATENDATENDIAEGAEIDATPADAAASLEAVSYTHLTLPTTPYV